MNSLVNEVRLLGYVGNNPEVFVFENGNQKTLLRICTNNVVRKKDGSYFKETIWHNAIAWGKNAEMAHQHINKGELICIKGKIDYREYTSKEGDTKQLAEINISALEFLGKSNRKEAF